VKNQNLVLPVVTLLTSVLLSACGWVDSTGSQLVPRTEFFLDDSPAGRINAVTEDSVALLTIDRSTISNAALSFSWGAYPVEQGTLPACMSLADFDGDYAETTRLAACSDPEDCSVSFEAVGEVVNNVAKFELTAPVLKAPVGLRYQLTVSDSNGVLDSTDYDFCLIAINEAPDAVADTFVVREGVREVFSSAETLLTSNDTDDIDVRNNPSLTVNTTPVRYPEHHTFFELRDDGSFTYESSATDLVSDQLDSFEYSVTDGVHTSTAQVTLRIVANNQAPEQIDDIPVLEAVVGELFVENLSLYFADPELSALSYSLAADSDFPAGGGFSLLSSGFLSGTPTFSDAGTYQLILLVSDGGREISRAITLIVNTAPVVPVNSAPSFVPGALLSRTVLLGDEISPIVPEFEDVDGDVLTYAIAGTDVLPAGISLDSTTGVISGRSLFRYRNFDIAIEATDTSGASVESDSFFIVVR